MTKNENIHDIFNISIEISNIHRLGHWYWRRGPIFCSYLIILRYKISYRILNISLIYEYPPTQIYMEFRMWHKEKSKQFLIHNKYL